LLFVYRFFAHHRQVTSSLSSHGYFLAIFDLATAMTNILCVAGGFNYQDNTGADDDCGINTLGAVSITITPVGGDLGIGIGGSGAAAIAAAPADDTTCYGFRSKDLRFCDR